MSSHIKSRTQSWGSAILILALSKHTRISPVGEAQTHTEASCGAYQISPESQTQSKNSRKRRASYGCGHFTHRNHSDPFRQETEEPRIRGHRTPLPCANSNLRRLCFSRRLQTQLQPARSAQDSREMPRATGVSSSVQRGDHRELLGAVLWTEPPGPQAVTGREDTAQQAPPQVLKPAPLKQSAAVIRTPRRLRLSSAQRSNR